MGKAKYLVIADELRTKITTGEYAVRTVIPSELQLQKIYQVSRHTVRQAIALLANEGYLRKEKGSGTYVDDAFKKTKNSQTKTIGVITTYLSDYIFPSIIRGIEQTLRKEGYSLLLASTNNDYTQEKECLEKMIGYGVDGLIVEPTKSNEYNPNLSLYVSLKEKNIPLVMINAYYEELDTAFIRVDDTKVGYLATKNLIDNQHKRLLFITKIDDLQGKYRMKGFIKACEEANLEFSPADIITYRTEDKDEVIQKAITRLEELSDMTGVVCYNDEIAHQLVEKLAEKDILVPDDISIVGNDNSNLSIVSKVALTTIDHPKEKMGEDAGKWIVETITSGKNSENIIYAPKLITRESVKTL